MIDASDQKALLEGQTSFVGEGCTTHDDPVATGEGSDEPVSIESGPRPSPKRLVPSLSVAGISGTSLGGIGGKGGDEPTMLAECDDFAATTDIFFGRARWRRISCNSLWRVYTSRDEIVDCDAVGERCDQGKV